jgi:LPXTG-motif cell wall-anchored protein
MKLHRVLAAAAVTAVIGPAALLAAPLAYADDPSTLTSSSSTGSGTTDSSTTTDTGGDTSSTTGDTSGTDSGDTTTDGTTTGDTSGTDSGGAETGGTDTGGTDTGGEKTPRSKWPRECNGEFDRFDKDLDAILTGFPSKIVAGSGFHNFTMNVTNNSDTARQRVYLGVYVAAEDAANSEDTTGYLTVQFKDPQSGMWKNVALNANWIEEDPNAGYATFTGISPAETVSLDLRLSVDAKTPAGPGLANAVAQYVDGEGTCNVDGGKELSKFEVLVAGSSSGKVPDAKPKPGTKTSPAQPSGETETTSQDQLAETGSSSALPTIATIGGVAMAIGAGAIVVVRRRKTADSGTAA